MKSFSDLFIDVNNYANMLIKMNQMQSGFILPITRFQKRSQQTFDKRLIIYFAFRFAGKDIRS